jgi:hypothetical protein
MNIPNVLTRRYCLREAHKSRSNQARCLRCADDPRWIGERARLLADADYWKSRAAAYDRAAAERQAVTA